jgi:hypothetical protein
LVGLSVEDLVTTFDGQQSQRLGSMALACARLVAGGVEARIFGGDARFSPAAA